MRELEVSEHVLGVIITQQNSLNVGKKRKWWIGHSNKRDISITRHKYIHNSRCFTFYKIGKKDAITSLILLTEKRDSKIKGRACADDRGQCGKSEKEDTASPKFATESIFITVVIGTHERRDLETIDIPGAFIHANSDDHIIMVLKRHIYLLIFHMNPKIYRRYIIFDKSGKLVL